MKNAAHAMAIAAACLLVLTCPFVPRGMPTTHITQTECTTTHTVQAERTITAVCAQVSYRETTSREQTKHTTAQKRATLDVSSDTYYHVVENTVRKYVAPAGYTVTRISRLQIPYFNIECRAQQKDVGALPETAFKITQKIYNDLLKYDFSAPGDIFQRTNEILSISYIVYDGAQASTRFDIQFNLAQIDRTKSFAENLTLKQLIRYPSIP